VPLPETLSLLLLLHADLSHIVSALDRQIISHGIAYGISHETNRFFASNRPPSWLSSYAVKSTNVQRSCE
jgi:hypothetical protein